MDGPDQLVGDEADDEADGEEPDHDAEGQNVYRSEPCLPVSFRWSAIRLTISGPSTPARDEAGRTETTTVCAYCDAGCDLTLHVQDNETVKVTSPHDNRVTHGFLCIEGRFGYQHLQNRG